MLVRYPWAMGQSRKKIIRFSQPGSGDSWMHDLPCFSGIEDSHLIKKILDAARIENFSDGTIVAKDGVADCLRIIVEGSVEIFHGNGAPTILVDGECFGFSWALGVSIDIDAKGARALSNVKCMALYDSDVQKVLQKEPAKGLNWAPLPSKLQGRPSTPCHKYMPQHSVEERPSTPYQLVAMSNTRDGAFDCESPEIRSRSSSPRSRSPRPVVAVPAERWAVWAPSVPEPPQQEVTASPPRSSSTRVRRHCPRKLPALAQAAQQENLPNICTTTWPPSRGGDVPSTWSGDHFPMPPTKPKASLRKPLLPLNSESRPCTADFNAVDF